MTKAHCQQSVLYVTQKYWEIYFLTSLAVNFNILEPYGQNKKVCQMFEINYHWGTVPCIKQQPGPVRLRKALRKLRGLSNKWRLWKMNGLTDNISIKQLSPDVPVRNACVWSLLPSLDRIWRVKHITYCKCACVSLTWQAVCRENNTICLSATLERSFAIPISKWKPIVATHDFQWKITLKSVCLPEQKKSRLQAFD